MKSSLWLVCIALILSVSACNADSARPDPAPNAGQAPPVANPPQKGERFHEFANVPSGPPVVDGYNPDLVGVEYDEDGKPITADASRRPVAEGPSVDGKPAVRRSAIKAFLKHGPRHPLDIIEIQPAFEGKSFIGYRVLAFTPEGAEHFSTALRQGDVVVSVNKRSVASPQEYMAAWNSLKDCESISVDLIRAGEKVNLSWPVVD